MRELVDNTCQLAQGRVKFLNLGVAEERVERCRAAAGLLAQGGEDIGDRKSRVFRQMLGELLDGARQVASRLLGQRCGDRAQRILTDTDPTQKTGSDEHVYHPRTRQPGKSG